MRVSLVLMVLAACGPAPVDLVGTWEGMLTTAPAKPSTMCPASLGRTEAGSYKIAAGPVLEAFGPCKNLKLEQTGSKATLKPTSCPADAVYLDGMEILAGSVDLEAKVLALSVTFKVGMGCEIVVTGSLTKKP